MLFKKKIERYCAYCIYSGKVDEGSMVCKKCGIVPAVHHCRRFRYDPLKRVPAKPQRDGFEKFNQSDFSL